MFLSLVDFSVIWAGYLGFAPRQYPVIVRFGQLVGYNEVGRHPPSHVKKESQLDLQVMVLQSYRQLRLYHQKKGIENAIIATILKISLLPAARFF